MLCGGFTLNRTICNSADRKAWSTLPPMSQPRTAAADAVDGSHLYLCGGSTSLDMATGRNETLRCSESYDALLEQWTPLPLMADLRLQAMAVWWAGRLYVFGGHHCNAPPVNMPERPTTSVQCFDPLWNNGTWNDLAPMSHGRVNAACLAAPEGIYLCGGESDSLGRGVLAASERFDTVRGSWEALPPLAGGPRTKAFSARMPCLRVVGWEAHLDNRLYEKTLPPWSVSILRWIVGNPWHLCLNFGLCAWLVRLLVFFSCLVAWNRAARQ
ncbi:unnamed protein product, partial [Polarella glacialis]